MMNRYELDEFCNKLRDQLWKQISGKLWNKIYVPFRSQLEIQLWDQFSVHIHQELTDE